MDQTIRINMITKSKHLAIGALFVAAAITATGLAATPAHEVKPLSGDLATEYKLDPAFYQKSAWVQDILIATSKRVSDYTILEAAYQFEMVMETIKPEVAKRIRER